MSQKPKMIGQANKAPYKGIPAATVQWTGLSSTSRSATIFNTFDASNSGDSSDTTGLQGEWLARTTIRQRIMLSIEAKPVGATQEDAQKIAEDLPAKDSLVTISNHHNTLYNSAGWIVDEDPSNHPSPEGEFTVSLRLRLNLDDAGAAIVPVVLAASAA